MKVNTFGNMTSDTDDLYSIAQISIAPNPVRDRLEINLNLSNEDKNLSLGLYNAQGQVLMTKQMTQAAIGRHSISWEMSHLPPGLYILSVKDQNGSAQSRRVMKL